mgnify:FL=1
MGDSRLYRFSGGENTQFILATFGDTFVVRAEDVPPKELSSEMEQIPFDERVTRLHTAISQGLDYFEELPRQRGELVCRAEGQVELPALTGEGKTESDAPPSIPPPEPPTQTPGGTGGWTPSPADPPAAPLAVPLIGGIAAIVVVILITAAVVLTQKKQKSQGGSSSAHAPQGEQAAIYMRLEVVRGTLASGQDQQELELRNELIIGSDPNRDVVVQSEDTAPRHACLFSVKGEVEALDFSSATQVNGEELQGGRRLRGGDEITVGSTVIRLNF